MSVTNMKEPSGFYIVRMSGIFMEQDRRKVENFGRTTIDRSGKVKVLILAEGFLGWAKEGNWGDLTFMHEYAPYIEKIAVVADEQWRDEMLIYLGAGLRKAAVKFFPQGQENKAREWLT